MVALGSQLNVEMVVRRSIKKQSRKMKLAGVHALDLACPPPDSLAAIIPPSMHRALSVSVRCKRPAREAWWLCSSQRCDARTAKIANPVRNAALY